MKAETHQPGVTHHTGVLATMMRRLFLLATIVFLLGFANSARINGQDASDFRVVVSMVQLNVAVTDKNGDYITGLRPQDFVITEDGITEKMATFAEGNAPAHEVNADAPPLEKAAEIEKDTTLSSLLAGSEIYVLFDTSNYMYRDFVFAQDAISEFVR